MMSKTLSKTLFSMGILLSAAVLTNASTRAAIALQAQTPPQPTAEELYQACTQDRAETLPNPFVDVSPQDWAYKAVLTMHYCGAFRQAAPRSLFDRAQPTQETQPTQEKTQLNRNSFTQNFPQSET